MTPTRTPKVVLIDNFDSFTWNLVHLLSSCGAVVEVIRNDVSTVDRITAERPTHIVISPGPKGPEATACVPSVIRWFDGRLPLLGVCLGHQTIAHVHGGRVVAMRDPIHGKTSVLEHAGEGLFHNVARNARVARYHSLCVLRESLPPDLLSDAWVAGRPDLVMGIRHRDHPTFGLQFHPESFMTDCGVDLIDAFLSLR